VWLSIYARSESTLCIYWFLIEHCPRIAEKAEAEQDSKKKKGGMSMPEEWPWEEAKMVFEKPDVTPADEIEVG
jgi:flap endonuclease-1